MRKLTLTRILLLLPAGVAWSCSHGTAGTATATQVAASAPCVLADADSSWLARAIRSWRDVGERVLELEPAPIPPLVLFDTRCVYQVTVGDRWAVTAAPHRGAVRLPNGRLIPPIGIGITSPARTDSSLFLALALPDAWRADPRYRTSTETRSGWEQYLVAAFSHEMAHARMLPGLLLRLRALEAAIYPDTIEDNLVQDRFARDPLFARSVARETATFARAIRARAAPTRAALIRDALDMMRERRRRFYVGELSSWSEVEQVFLDLEGVAQWTALYVTNGATRLPTGEQLDRLLLRFRATREFWSEDQGLMMILALDQVQPDWQRRMMAPNGATAFELLDGAVR